jgi:hypothetical protein
MPLLSTSTVEASALIWSAELSTAHYISNYSFTFRSKPPLISLTCFPHAFMMHALNLVCAVAISVLAVRAQDLLTDITKIQKYWGQISPYADNPEDHFGVGFVGLPDGCQIVSKINSYCSKSC